MDKMSIDDIFLLMKKIKAERKKIIQNYYMNYNNTDMEFDVYQGEGTVVFCCMDGNGVYRCFFYSNAPKVLSSILSSLQKDTIVDYLSRVKEEDHSWLTEAGFLPYALYIRVGKKIEDEEIENKSNIRDILSELYDSQCGQYAALEDLDQLYDLIVKVFDCRKEHCPTKKELAKYIENQWVLVYKEDNEILSYFIYQVHGKRYYSNISYNTVTADILYSLERRALEEAQLRYDLNYMDAWYDTKNKKALRRCIMPFDGTYDYIYIKSKN